MHNLQLKLKRIKEFVLDLIFPKECFGCGYEGVYLCESCQAKIEINSIFKCALCHQESILGQICNNCQKDTFLKTIWVATDYNNKILQCLIHNLKFKYIEEISSILANLAIKYLKHYKIFEQFDITDENSIIVTVPLHKKRLLSRGFNQSDLLAQEISNYFKIPFVKLISRQKNTQTQIGLDRQSRQKNVQNAFSLNNYNNYKNKKIILIDDVVTTGSTLKECARVLANAGFTEIYGLVVAQRED
jgi:ComF family protein